MCTHSGLPKNIMHSSSLLGRGKWLQLLVIKICARYMQALYVSYKVCCNTLLCCCHQAKTIWFYCSDKVNLRSVLFHILMEYITLVNEMLLMISGDIEPNPGPGEYLSIISLNLPSVSTHITLRIHTRFMTLHVTISQISLQNPTVGMHTC